MALDAQGDIVWSEQGGPPAAGRLLAYNPQTGRVARVVSAHLPARPAIGPAIGLIGVSPHWIVFSLIADRFTGGHWQIVAHDRSNGRERVVAASPIGQPEAAQFVLDGDVLVWVQPAVAGGATVQEENLRTGQRRSLASTTQGVYWWLDASRGHVAWEWLHNHSIGLVALYSLTTGRHLVLDQTQQYMLTGNYVGNIHLGDGMMAGVGTDLRGHYGLAIFHLHGTDPLDAVLTCRDQPAGT